MAGAADARPFEVALSPRRTQILLLIAEGRTTRQIAQGLGISVKTAAAHRSAVMQVLNLHTTAELVRYAVRKGIVAA